MAQDNLDSNVLNSLPEVDDRAVQQFFREVQQRFQGDYVVDLAGLRQTAHAMLPLLESREETQPYAAWLAAQMDYFDVADEIRSHSGARSGNQSTASSRLPIRRRKPNANFG